MKLIQQRWYPTVPTTHYIIQSGSTNVMRAIKEFVRTSEKWDADAADFPLQSSVKVVLMSSQTKWTKIRSENVHIDDKIR